MDSNHSTIIGPAYKDFAKKYKGDKPAEARLIEKVKVGGSGVYGARCLCLPIALK